MRSMTAAGFAALAHAEVARGDAAATVRGVSIDSRTVEAGDVFAALAGERAHGAAFVSDAIARGATAVLVPADRRDIDARADVAVIVAPDTLVALQTAAASYREGLDAVVVGITGSTGKTTTKDLLAGALGASLAVVSAEKSHNNEIGVPLTLLAADPATDVVVAELAMRGAGQIRELARIAQPRVGVVVNVGVTHFELLGSVEAIARAKGELLEELPPDGLAVVNGDDRNSAPLAGMTRARVTRFGLGDDNQVRAAEVTVGDDGLVRFVAEIGGARAAVRLPLMGRHNVYNALAALAVADELGVPLEAAAAGLAEARPSPMRMDVFGTAAGVTVVNDCYNASPASMEAALDTVASMRVDGRRVAVLGEMLELGALSVDEHIGVGKRVTDAGIALLVTVGEGARSIAAGALEHGLEEAAWVSFADAEAAAAGLGSLIRRGDTVLVKASRLVGLERVVEALANGAGPAGRPASRGATAATDATGGGA